MSKEYTKQHIVPKCYLDRFAVFKNGRYVIGTRYVSKDKKVKLFEDSTANVGYIRNYYDVSDKDDPKYWEHFFANKIDSLCDIKLENVISSIQLAGSGFILGESEKRLLATIMTAQMLRVPSSIDYVKNCIVPRVAAKVKKQVYSEMPDSIIRKNKKIIDAFQLSETTQKEFYLNSSFDEECLARYAEVLVKRIWIILENTISVKLPFVTSDNPVLVENLGDQASLGIFPNGLANPNTCLFFPLTPAIAVVNYSDRGLFSNSATNLDGRIIQIDEVKYICARNLNMIEQAYKHSFIPQPLFERIKSDNT